MTFLSPLAGLIAAALAVPALLLLYFLKLRRREQAVPSTLLWRKAVQDLQVNAPFQKLRRNLLLVLQMLLLIALALALSQPAVPYRPAAGASNVLLIDRSASMSATDGNASGGTRLEEAKARAKSLLDTLSGGSRAMVIAFDDQAEIVQGFTSDTQLLKKSIDEIQPSDRRTRMKLAYQLADAQGTMRAGAIEDGSAVTPPDVFVYSDGRAADAGELSLRGTVRYEPIGKATSKNVGIVSLSARRNYERPTEVQVFARLISSGPEPVTTDLQLTVDGAVQKVARVTLVPDGWSQEQRQAAEKEGVVARDAAEFTIELPTAAIVRVEQMNKEGDVLAADDSASVVVPQPRSLAVTVVSDGNNPFLSRLVKSLSLRDPQELTSRQYEDAVAAGNATRDVILFDNYRPKALPPTGNFVYFGVLPEGLRLTAKTRDGALVTDPEIVGVLDWKRDHPILRGLSLGKLYGAGAITLVPAGESEVLVEGVRGPLVVLHREGRSIHLAVAFDPLNSNWPFLVSYPVFVHNTLQFIATSSDLSVRESYPPGSTPRLPRTSLGDLRSITLSGPGMDRQIAIEAVADGRQASAMADVVLPALDRVGIFEIAPKVEGFERLAVNLLEANESVVIPTPTAPGGIGETVVATTGSSKARLELWWWLVAAVAMPLLLVEWWVYTRRTHL